MCGRWEDTFLRPSKLILGREFLCEFLCTFLAPDMGHVRVHVSPFAVICQWESRIYGQCQDWKELGLNLLNSI